MPIQKRECEIPIDRNSTFFSLISLGVMTASKLRLDNTLLVLRRRQPALRSLDQATRCLAHPCQQKHLLQNLSITSSGLLLQSLSSSGINTRRRRNGRSQGDVGRTRRKEGGGLRKGGSDSRFISQSLRFPLYCICLYVIYTISTLLSSCIASKRERVHF